MARNDDVFGTKIVIYYMTVHQNIPEKSGQVPAKNRDFLFCVVILIPTCREKDLMNTDASLRSA